MEIRHRELSHAPVDGLAVAEHGVIGFRDPAPTSVHFEQCDEMINVMPRGLQVEDERTVTVHAERERREERALHAVRSIASQRDERRRACLGDDFLVDRNRVEKILNLSWRVELSQYAELGEGGDAAVHAESIGQCGQRQ